MEYKIALICHHGASTGMLTVKMRKALEMLGLEGEITAYSMTQLDNIIEEYDVILLAPQQAYKLMNYQSEFPMFRNKFKLIEAIDFGMMNGEKVCKEAVSFIDKLKKGEE